ncbi:MAG: 2,3-bisphosphoglycerate-independent phosphoglycerate mutase [Alphaproteobacteria bacterium]|nr:2,3-bisphosphoglycerate-independent phosphoglycerate mutase [Alphaproteobacteria bacterium]
MASVLFLSRRRNRMKPLVLCILDGVGIRETESHNAWKEAKTPFFDSLKLSAKLDASGVAVGLMAGQMGNSEVGHMNIGAGRVVKQLLPQINDAVAEGTLNRLPHFQHFVKTLKETGGACHLWGLLSPGGVHAHQDHLVSLALSLAHEGIKVWWHVVADGRDTPPKSILNYVKDIREKLAGDSASDRVHFATFSGRYYAMDRNQNGDRTELAFNAIVHGEGETATTLEEGIQQSYDAGKTDEFILPTVLGNYSGIQKGDAILFGNFRADRVRQLAGALMLPMFDLFDRELPPLSLAMGLSEYSQELNQVIESLFPPQKLDHVLGKVLEENNLRQLRLAETEKYAHVTFFFDGGEEHKYENDTRILVPSPAVATYDLQPEMSAEEVSYQLISQLDKTDVVIMNYANGDMVGHTGVEEAAIQAVETLDHEVSRIWKEIQKRDGTLLITADHGNCEKMAEENGLPFTAHTTNPVPLWILSNEKVEMKRTLGKLADIAPTILKLLNIKQPEEMTGESLV